MALAEEAHARNNDTVFSDSEPGMQSTLGSAEEPAELEGAEVRTFKRTHRYGPWKINTEEMNQPAGVEEKQGSVNPIVDTHVSSPVSALVGSLTGSPSISRRASSIRPDSIAEGEALAEEHEKYVPYRLSMPRSSSAKPPTYTCYSPSLQHLREG
ncbi:hypothetical protein KC330_g2747 [Hortaea werneckii]|nr:hypothetical protein KC330_g2747 [Hortaea werneckii]